MPKLLSVIVPIYKQEKTLRRDLTAILKALEKAQLNYELIGVVDGKADQSFKAAGRIKNPKLRVYQLEKNHGKGYAIRYGMARSTGDLISFIDAGGEIDAEGIHGLYQQFVKKKADIIIGSKRHPESQVQYPPLRRVLSVGYQTLVFFLFGLRVRDTQVGLKLFRRGVLEDVLPRLLVKRYAFDIEILAVASHLGYKKIFEAPIVLKYNFTSYTTAASWSTIRNMLIDTLAVFYRLRIQQYYENANKRRWVYDKDLDFRVNIG